MAQATGGSSSVGMGAVAIHPIATQPGGPITAHWDGDFESGSIHLIIAGPVAATTEGAGDQPDSSIDPATAARGHYSIIMVIEGQVQACSDPRLHGAVTVEGGGVAGFVADLDLKMLMCPADKPVAVAVGGFDLP
ncbi:MAG TPA: hypothetical protein VHB27_12515 [Rhodopila sp.]|uniref:hypothetical protein n=1 Tax=Rhodopila sp. TaxID=2480087 RepID=UPI002D17573D|nr:hypothetical protein [Rhodopila sp.]HVY16041.1 hypothetical protein [Rhodopila sp.]